MMANSEISAGWVDWKAFSEARRKKEAIKKHKNRIPARRTDFSTKSKYDPPSEYGYWKRLDKHNRGFKFSEKRNMKEPYLKYELWGDRSKGGFYFKLYRTLIITDHLNLDPYLRSRVCDRVVSKKHDRSGITIDLTILIESAIAMYEDPRLNKNERRQVHPQAKNFDPVLSQMIADCGVRFKDYKRQFYRYISGGGRGKFIYHALRVTSRDRHYLPYVRVEEPLPWVEPNLSADVETGEVYKPTSMVYGEGNEATEQDDRVTTSSNQDTIGTDQSVSGEA